MPVIEEIGSSVVHTNERFRVVNFVYASVATAAATVGTITVPGLLASESVVTVTPARTADTNTTRYITTLARTGVDTISWTNVGTGIVGNINMSALIFSPSKVVL